MTAETIFFELATTFLPSLASSPGEPQLGRPTWSRGVATTTVGATRQCSSTGGET